MSYRNAVGIIGCGWIGLPLSTKLAEKGFRLHIITRDAEKAEVLAELGHKTYVINWNDEREAVAVVNDLAQRVQTLIFSIPPAYKQEQSDLLRLIQLTQEALVGSRVKHVLYLSSIGVYGDTPGFIDENTRPIITHGKAQLLLDAERLWTNFDAVSTSIARLGGLIGSDRHPVFHLSGRTDIDSPSSVVNLIHQDDVVGLLTVIIENKIWGETFNLVTPYHPTRRDYYTEKALGLGIAPPGFSNKAGLNRVISPDKILSMINYRFIHPLL